MRREPFWEFGRIRYHVEPGDEASRVRVLILSFYFAPTNTIAAHRLTAIARFLHRQGHEIKVVTARQRNMSRDFDADVSGIEVIETRPSVFAGAKVRNSTPQPHPDPSRSRKSRIFWPTMWLKDVSRGLRTTARHLTVWPDKHVGWALFALPALLSTIRRWRPDLIYASSPPATCIALGAIVSRLTRVRWVCEMRDRWADDPYYPRPTWRTAGERALEKMMLRSSHGIVSISRSLARNYSTLYGKPASSVYTGFDPETYRQVTRRPAAGLPVRLVYTGSVYAGRDPTPLWQALVKLGEAAKDIRVEFYGALRDEVLPNARRHGVDHLVTVEEYVPHDRATELQCGADFLLMLQWDDPTEEGNMPGKIFEYLGARRPILAMGYLEGEMAQMIRRRKAGLFSNDPDTIANRLRECLEHKKTKRELETVSSSCTSDLTRDAQFDQLLTFLSRV